MAKYTPPEWSASGRNAFGIFLEVIKGGLVVESLSLPRTAGRSFVVAGRMETVCDLPLAHPSISRVHAALQFDEQGALFLYDLRSTHGCFVNKKRVLAEEFVRLHIGDVVVFGESTRLYAVCGPPELLPAEYESLNLAKFRERLANKREIQANKKQEEQRGASWGFGEDAEEDDDASDEEEDTTKAKDDLPDYLHNLREEEQPYKSSVRESHVNEKDQRLYQQLQTRIRKMENLKLEKSRILAKQNQLDGLSEGQQRTLERNEQRIEALMKEIDELEARIHTKNDQRTKTTGASGAAVTKTRDANEELYGYSSDEDDFYDRTKANKQKLAARKQKVAGFSAVPAAAVATPAARVPTNEVLTADSIQAAVKKLEAELVNLQDDISAASAKTAENQASSGESKHEEEADPLDSFMAATTTQLHVSEVDSLTKRKAELEGELKRQRQLLAVATPALAALPVQKSVDESAKSISPASLLKATRVGESPASDAATSVKSKSTESAKAEVAAKQDPHPESRTTSSEKKPSEVGKPEARATAPQKAPEKPTEKPASESHAPKRRRISGPAMGPPPQQTKPSALSEQQSVDSDLLEGGDQAWVPPSNQTGDGRTELNDKLGY